MVHLSVPFRTQYWNIQRWKEMGFSSLEEAHYWQRSCCGVLSLGMVLQKKGIHIPTADLIAKGMHMGAYSHKNGWSHRGLIRLASHYGMDGRSLEGVSLNRLRGLLDEGNLVIVSIRWAFNRKSLRDRLFMKDRGGHLALVTGYDNTGFYVHHTSIRQDYNWPDKLVVDAMFNEGFTGRVVALKL